MLIRLVCLLPTLVTAAFAAVPVNLAGFVYTELTIVSATGDARGSFRREILLTSDGGYTGLFLTIQGGLTGFVPKSSIPGDGRWAYQKLDEQKGRLTLDGVTKTITFSSDLGGEFELGLTTTGTFSLTAYDGPTPLTNCSNRSVVRAGGSAFTGFVLTSSSRGRVLVRAVGPSLSQFGITDALRRPTLMIVQANTNAVKATNSGWSGDPAIVQANARAGAFALLAGSADSAVLLSLTPGAYTAQVSSPDSDDSGQVLIEIYMLP